MKSAIGAQDWTPRLNFSNPGRSAAATGGLSMGSRITGGSCGKNQDHGRRRLPGSGHGWRPSQGNGEHQRCLAVRPSDGGGGWVIGIALKGTNVELPGVGRIEWVAGGRCGKDPAHELGGQGVLVPGGVRRHGGGNARTHPSFYEPVARLASSEKHRVRLRRRRRGSRRTGTTN